MGTVHADGSIRKLLQLQLAFIHTTSDPVMAKALLVVFVVFALLCSRAAAQLGIGVFGGIGPYFQPGPGYGGYARYGGYGGYGGYPGFGVNGGYGGFGPSVGFFFR
ncbi:hypothetical protein MTO96_031302 [Rhipicephalus appendiculatus]